MASLRLGLVQPLKQFWLQECTLSRKWRICIDIKLMVHHILEASREVSVVSVRGDTIYISFGACLLHGYKES
jgi:hypothetical protein